MALLTATKLNDPAGVDISALLQAADAGGETFEPSDDLSRLLVKNDSAGSIDVTITVPETALGGLTISDRVVSVAAGVIQAVPLLRAYADPTDGLIDITLSATASVEVAAVRS